MNRHLTPLLLIGPLILASPLLGQELLWDNHMRGDGTGGKAVSPPGFPDIRVMDDLIIDSDDAWLITGFHAGTIEDDGWTHGDVTEVYVRAHDPDTDLPVWREGNELFNVVLPHRRMATGDQYFGRDAYNYWFEGLSIPLEPGIYWIGFRHPEAGGAGTAYWLEGPGGPDGIESRDYAFSLDRGATWIPEGHHVSFEIHGSHGLLAAAERFEVTRGVRIQGGTISIQSSDDEYLVVEARRPSSVSQPSVQVVVESTSPVESPAALSIRVEASVLLEGPIQWIDLYDFEVDDWERVDERLATQDDSVVEVTITESPERFIEPGSRNLRTRVSHYDPGLTFAGWIARIDQVQWRIYAK